MAYIINPISQFRWHLRLRDLFFFTGLMPYFLLENYMPSNRDSL